MARDVLGRDVEDAGLGGQDEETVLRERPAGGTETVAVEGRAEAGAVREGDGGGAVPRLHQRGVVLVERADVVPHVVLCAPGLRDEHHHRVGRVAPGGDQQLEHVVERGGVALPLVNDRQELLQLVAEERRGQRRLARGEGVEVPLEGVDLAVVREGAEGVRKFPRREGVRGIALVDDGERRDEVGVGEIGIELLDLRREEEALVDDRARRAGADVGFCRRFLDQAADDVEAALAVCVRCGDKDLPYPWHHGAGIVADGVGIRRHVAPSENVAPLGPNNILDRLFFSLAAKYHRDAERPVFAVPLRLCARYGLLEEPVWNLHQQPGAVACLGVVAGGAAMHEPLEDRQARRDDLVAGLAREVGHHSDAACVMFIFAPVKALSFVFVLLVHGSQFPSWMH